MLKKIKRVLGNERGGQFLEGGLWIVLVVFVIAVAGAGLAAVVASKFNALKEPINALTVPTFGIISGV